MGAALAADLHPGTRRSGAGDAAAHDTRTVERRWSFRTPPPPGYLIADVSSDVDEEGTNGRKQPTVESLRGARRHVPAVWLRMCGAPTGAPLEHSLHFNVWRRKFKLKQHKPAETQINLRRGASV